jgi:hypothetical protein
MITSEPLVEASVSKFRFGEEPSKSQKQNLQPWNEAQLNFVSLRSSLHYVGLGGLSRVEMNAQKRAPLTTLPTQREKCV